MAKLGKYIKEIKTKNSDGTIDRVLSVSNRLGFVEPIDIFDKRVASQNVDNYKVVKKGQFAYNPSRLLVGSLAYLEEFEEGILSPMYVVFEANKKVSQKFLYYWLKLEDTRVRFKSCTQGSVRNSVSFKDLITLDVDVPSLDKQNEIVGILDELTLKRDALENEIEKLISLKKSIIQKLFSEDYRVCRDAKEGNIFPKDWGEYLFRNILEDGPKNGFSPSEIENYEGVKVLSLGCVSENGFYPKQLKNIPDSEQNEQFVLREGDFLITRANTRHLVGMASIYKDVGVKAIYPDLMMRVKFKDFVNPKFMQYLFNQSYLKKQVSNSAQGTSETMVKINGTILRNTIIYIPELAEQNRIVSVIEKVEQLISANKKMLDKLEQLFMGVATDLMIK